MLALHARDDRLRRTDHLLPTAEGALETRPGAVQILAGPVAAAEPWGERIVAEKSGRIVIWDGDEHDLCAAGAVLQAASFQALTGDALREDRAYIADGVSALWYAARRSGAYVRESVVNTVLDDAGAPYPIPVPWAIATWRNRLWVPASDNRVQHCQNDRPDEWDPLWTVECQGKEPGRVMAIIDHGQSLGVGLSNAVWSIEGTSQYNWTRDEVLRIGVAGANAMDGDGARLLILAPQGVFMGNDPTPLSEDIREAFAAPIGVGSLVLDTRRQLALVLVAGRLFAMHLARPGQWGEIPDTQANGLLRAGGQVGWYGEDGVWLLMGRDSADKLLDGTERAFTSRYDTWEQRPNLTGNGRALCERTLLEVQGSARADATYTVRSGARAFTTTFSLVDEPVDTWADTLDGDETWLAWPTPPVRRELVPRLDGESFRHSITADCYLQVRQFDPRYRFGQED